MRILVDADACPVVKIIEKVANENSIPVILFYDTSHSTQSDYSEIVIVSKGADAVDYALISKLKSFDIVVTQDYGVATMALTKKAYVINQNGREYTTENIDRLLFERHMAKKIRESSSKSHLKGPRKRTDEDNKIFEMEFEKLINRIGGSNDK